MRRSFSIRSIFTGEKVMTIYKTEFDPETKEALSPSEPTQYVSLNDVILHMGQLPDRSGKRVIIYNQSDPAVAFSDFVVKANDMFM